MNIWIVGIGEPLIIDGENVRLRRVGNLAKYISETDNEINYFSVSFDHYQKSQRVNEDTTFKIKDNYSLHVAYVPGYRKNVSVQRIISHKISAKKIKNLMIKEKYPDVILAGNTPLEVISMVAEYGVKNNVPVVMDMRDLWPEVFKDAIPKHLGFLINPYVQICKKSFSNTAKKAFSIIGLSEAFMNYGLTMSGRNKKDVDKVIPIGYPNYSYDVSEKEFNNKWGKYGIHSKDFIIAFTGNFGRQFKFDDIIEASQKLIKNENIKFVLCGSGENLEAVKKQCLNNVVFPGWVEKDMINSLLSYASVGIAPYINSFNYRNNTPNKFGEYLSAGLPILVSVSGIMENLLKDNSCGVRYKNGEHLAQLIIEYVNSESQLNIAKKSSRRLYEEQFNADDTNERLFNHLQFVKKAHNMSNLK